jgi:hypothetical protein
MMAFEIAPARSRHDRLHSVLDAREADSRSAESEIGALKAENAELRKVVIALSKLVIRNVLRNDVRP